MVAEHQDGSFQGLPIKNLIPKNNMVRMTLTVYNTLSRSKEPFVPFKDKRVNMFVCGQTVYDDAHLGHARTYVCFDIVVRWLRHLGYKVKYIQSITDIEDKIVGRAMELGKDPVELARHYEKRFLEDMEALGVSQNVDLYPRSHDYINAIKDQIQLLIDRGYAYVVDGDIYYDVSKFSDYVKLSGVKLEELEKHRIEPNPDKRNVYDFSLWKRNKSGEPFWKIKLMLNNQNQEFVGRPGWHIEDTAITHSIFGVQYDLHGGALELIFPHHTNEIAQAEAAYGKKPFVKYWLHSGVLNIKGEKMSKSLKNFITIRKAREKYNPETIRLFVASTHYRKEVEYSENLLKEASRRLGYMYNALSVFYNTAEGNTKDDKQITGVVKKLEVEFDSAMNDDFNTVLALNALSEALAGLRNFAETHQKVGKKTKTKTISTVLGLADILGILKSEGYKELLPREALELIRKRDAYRLKGEFEEADLIRKELDAKFKIKLEDTRYGTIWYKTN